MQIPFVVQREASGHYRAQAMLPLNTAAEGKTRDEAISMARYLLQSQLKAGKQIVMVDIAVKEENK